MSVPPNLTTDLFGSDGHQLAESSEQLLQRVRRGDREAIESLMARYLPRLMRWTSGRLPRWARDVADTADLVQDVLTRTLPKLGQISPPRERALQAYLRRAVTNRIRDQYRHAIRQPETVQLPDEYPASDASPLDCALQQDIAAHYSTALQRLSAADRDLVVARLELDYTYDQIAVMLGRPSADAARMAVSRALVRMAREMARD